MASPPRAKSSDPPRPGSGLLTGPLPVLAAAALWGTTGTAASFAPQQASPLAIGAATMGIGGLLLLVTAPGAGRAVFRSGDVRSLLVGAVAVAVYPLAFYSSMALAGVAIGTVITIGSAPVFAALLERVVDGMHLDLRWAVAAAVAVLGGVLLVTGHDRTSGGPDVLGGALLGLLGGATYVGYSWTSARLMRRGHSSREVLGATFGSGAVLLLPVLVVTGGPLLGSTGGLLVAGYLALVPMSFAYVLYGAGLRNTSTSAATTLSLLEPVVAALLSVLVVGESLGVQAWTGIALVCAGLLVVSRRA